MPIDVELLEKLTRLKEEGILSEDEFLVEKARVLANDYPLGHERLGKLRTIDELRSSGSLGEKEFAEQKAHILRPPQPQPRVRGEAHAGSRRPHWITALLVIIGIFAFLMATGFLNISKVNPGTESPWELVDSTNPDYKENVEAARAWLKSGNFEITAEISCEGRRALSYTFSSFRAPKIDANGELVDAGKPKKDSDVVEMVYRPNREGDPTYPFGLRLDSGEAKIFAEVKPVYSNTIEITDDPPSARNIARATTAYFKFYLEGGNASINVDQRDPTIRRVLDACSASKQSDVHSVPDPAPPADQQQTNDAIPYERVRQQSETGPKLSAPDANGCVKELAEEIGLHC